MKYQVLADQPTYFENHHHQKHFYAQKIESCIWNLTILSCSASNSAFVANFESFVFQSESFKRMEKLDSFFLFIFKSSISMVHLL